MSFFGATIKRGDSLSLQATDAELVHLSNLVLVGDVKTGDQFRVSVSDENKKEYVAAILSHEHLQHTCDLYLSAGAKVSFTQSNGKPSKVEVHLTGYTEPADLVSEDGDATDSGDESLDEGAKAQLAKQVQAYLKSKIGGKAEGEEESSEEEGSENEEASDDEEEAAEAQLRAAIEKKVKKTAAKKAESEDEEEADSDDDDNESAQDDEENASSEESDVEVDSAAAKKKAEAAIAKIQAAVVSSDDEEADSDDEEADSDDEDAMEEKAPGSQEVEDSSDESADENEKPVAQVDSSDESQEEDEESSEEEEEPKKPAPKKGGKQQPKKEEVAAPVNDKKRKATGSPETSPPSKKAATGGDAYETAVVEFVKAAGGSCKISHIGARVKKPADFKGKLGQWLKDRTKTFKVSGDSVSLVAKK